MSLATRVQLGNVTNPRRTLSAASAGSEAVPASKQWATPIGITVANIPSLAIPMYGNVQVGDCTCATVGHLIEVWCANNGSAYLPSTADILYAYRSTPNAGGGGRDMAVVLDYFKNHGIASAHGLHKIFWREVAPTRNSVQQTTYFLGGCVVTLNLPNSVKTGRVWRVSATGSTAGGFGSHAVAIIGYNATGPIAATWDRFIPMTWAFYAKYVEQVFAVLGWDWMGADGNSPGGHTWKELATQFSIT